MSNGAQKRTPDGVDVNWVTSEISWPFPTWVDQELYDDEFKDNDPVVSGQLLTNMFNYLGAKIDKALATAAAEIETIEFKYWRKLNDKATKMKPTKLRATLYRHPDYDKVWLRVEKA
jgi:hypothetical protein